MERLSPYDHFVALVETEKSPMNIGALLVFDAPTDEKPEFARRVRAQLEERVPRTVLARRLAASPDQYDSDAWFGIGDAAAIRQIRTPVFPDELSYAELRDYVTRRGMQHLDVSKAPFEIDILGQVSGPRCAIYLKMHHSVMDGVGFQSLIQLLSDDNAAVGAADLTDVVEEVPSPEDWREMARRKFETEEPFRRRQAELKATSAKKLEEFLSRPGNRRRSAPEMPFGWESSDKRDYRTVSFSLDAFRSVGKQLEGSINDVFLATASGALRRYLGERDQLPPEPIVAHSVRSYRREEHGLYGNRVLSIYPELATNEPDPVTRLRRIRASMNVEKQRSLIEEGLQDVWDSPFGARDRRAACADLSAIEGALGSANVVLSNVPGPSYPLTFAGFTLAANYPVPIVGPRLFLNITSRRNADSLDMGVMVDAAKIHDADDFVACLEAAFEDLTTVARARR